MYLSWGHVSTHHIEYACCNQRKLRKRYYIFPSFCNSQVFRWLCMWLSCAVLIDFPWNVYPSVSVVNSEGL